MCLQRLFTRAGLGKSPPPPPSPLAAPRPGSMDVEAAALKQSEFGKTGRPRPTLLLRRRGPVEGPGHGPPVRVSSAGATVGKDLKRDVRTSRAEGRRAEETAQGRGCFGVGLLHVMGLVFRYLR